MEPFRNHDINTHFISYEIKDLRGIQIQKQTKSY